MLRGGIRRRYGNARTLCLCNLLTPRDEQNRHVLWSVLKLLASTGLCANLLISISFCFCPVRTVLFRSLLGFRWQAALHCQAFYPAGSPCNFPSAPEACRPDRRLEPLSRDTRSRAVSRRAPLSGPALRNATARGSAARESPPSRHPCPKRPPRKCLYFANRLKARFLTFKFAGRKCCKIFLKILQKSLVLQEFVISLQPRLMGEVCLVNWK